MHSKHHRRERQRIAAFRFVSRNGRRAPNANAVTPAEAWRNHIAWRVICTAQEERQAKEITLGIICKGLHRTKLPCGNYAVTGNPVTVRIAPNKKLP